MAKQHFLIPARLTHNFPLLRKMVWFIEACIVRILIGIIRLMSPERAARYTAALFMRLSPVIPFSNKIRANLSVAFPDKDGPELDSLTRNVCGNLGNAVVDMVLAERIWHEREERIEFVSEQGVDIADYRDQPAVMVTGHIGAWQISTFIAAQFDLPVTSIFAPEKNPYLRDYFSRMRAALPCRWVSRDGCMRGLTKELRQKNMVGLVSDTRLDGGDSISFFGLSAPTNTTAARLALRHKCDLLPVRAERLPGMRFRITLCRPIRPEDPDASVTAQAKQMTQVLSDHFEAWVRDAPDQWMCYGRRWPREVYGDTADKRRAA